jgi:addiction module HigA family antidote
MFDDGPDVMTPAAPVARRGKVPPGLGLPSRTPPHPGQFLETRFMKPLAISQTELAAALGVSRRRVNELIRGRRAITPDTALRLAMYFGNDATFWMHLQVAWDMRAATKRARTVKRRS